MATQRRRNGKGSGKANPAEDEAVYQAILHALLEGKLKAGTKLAEPPLADIFGVSRERIRGGRADQGAHHLSAAYPNCSAVRSPGSCRTRQMRLSR